MTKRVVRLASGPAPLDIASHGRGGRFTRSQIEAIARTVRNVPEVVVKVSGGGRDVGAVQAHLGYIGRHGRVALERDDGEAVRTMGEIRALLREWGLTTAEKERRRNLSGRAGRKAQKLVHNIVFSMPAGTQAKKVLKAVHNFAHEHWGLSHRYLMALHTDTEHPHVHVVVSALGEDGRRLLIDRDLLRHWRQQFAAQLRTVGVEANATDRSVRGRVGRTPKDGLYRAMRSGRSTELRARVRSVAADLTREQPPQDPTGDRLRARVRRTQALWRQTGVELGRVGQVKLSEEAREFAQAMPPPRSDAESIASDLRARLTAPADIYQRRDPRTV